MKNRAVAKAVSIYEYSEEEHIRMEREEAFQAGIEQEKINTDREKERADKAVSKVKDMEAELRKLREKIEKYKKEFYGQGMSPVLG